MSLLKKNKSIFESLLENLDEDYPESNDWDDEDNLMCAQCGKELDISDGITPDNDPTVAYCYDCALELGVIDDEGNLVESQKEVINETDSKFVVSTPMNVQRDYSIVDITELNNISDGDVRPPMLDISELLVEAHNKINESASIIDINVQSTKSYGKDNKSNALFELTAGDKTYLMSMVLEGADNGSTLKVNNTMGKTIFKRKTVNPIETICEYFNSFIPLKESAKDDSLKGRVENYLSKSGNEELKMRYDYTTWNIKNHKKNSPEYDIEHKFILKSITSLVAEIPVQSLLDNEPEDDKTNILTFDNIVEELFGKDWVTKPEVERDKKKIKLVPEVKGTEVMKESSEISGSEIQRLADIEAKKQGIPCNNTADRHSGDYLKIYNNIKREMINKTKEIKESLSVEKIVNDFKNSDIEKSEDGINEFFTDLFYEVEDEEDIDNLNKAEDIIRKEYLSESEIVPTEEDEKGEATFIRSPKNIEDIYNQINNDYTSGKSEYIVVKTVQLSYEEFKDLTSDFTVEREYLKDVEEKDTDNFAYNAVKITGGEETLLIDPVGTSVPKRVAVLSSESVI